MRTDTSKIQVTGHITFKDEKGDEHEFKVEGMTSIYSACNKIIQMFAMGNVIDDFIKERVVVTKDPQDFVNGMTVKAEFMAWMTKNGHNYGGGRNTLYKELAFLHGVRRVSGTNRAGFRGMKLLFGDKRLDGPSEDLDLI